MIIIRIDGSQKDYDDFVDDLATKMAEHSTKTDKREFVSQRKACQMFGRRNVERWRRDGKIRFYKRPGKVEYKIADLRRLFNTEQDYFVNTPEYRPASARKEEERLTDAIDGNTQANSLSEKPLTTHREDDISNNLQT